jgi:hypothetical protein
VRRAVSHEHDQSNNTRHDHTGHRAADLRRRPIDQPHRHGFQICEGCLALLIDQRLHPRALSLDGGRGGQPIGIDRVHRGRKIPLKYPKLGFDRVDVVCDIRDILVHGGETIDVGQHRLDFHAPRQPILNHQFRLPPGLLECDSIG